MTTVRTEARVSRLSLRGRRLLWGYLLVAPVLIWRLLIVVYPFFYTAYLSFTNTQPINRTDDFVGLENYARLLTDRNFYTSAEFTLIFTFSSVAIQLVLGLAVAELLNQRFALRNVVRAVNLLPWAMSGIVTAVAAQWAFNADYGLVSDLIWRVTGERPLWLVDPTLARLAVILTDVWKNTPFLAVIFLSGLQGISLELYEAAQIDGASRWRSFTQITLPLMMPLILTMTVFAMIWRLLTFELVYGMTKGGPGRATALLSYSVYQQAFGSLNFGYAAAISMSLFAMVLILGVAGIFLVRRAWAKYY